MGEGSWLDDRYYGWSENEDASETESSSDSEEKDPEEMILDVKNIADTILFISSFHRCILSFTQRSQAAGARGSERGVDRAPAASSLFCFLSYCNSGQPVFSGTITI